MYKRHRFPPEFTQHVVWLEHCFTQRGHDIEDLMVECGIAISYESIRLWCIEFSPKFARRMPCRHQGYDDTLFIDEVFVRIERLQHYVAHRELIPDSIHDTAHYANNRAALSHQPTRVRERGMRRFKCIHQAQRFLRTRAAVFNLGHHLASDKYYRYCRQRTFVSWKSAAAI